MVTSILETSFTIYLSFTKVKKQREMFLKLWTIIRVKKLPNYFIDQCDGYSDNFDYLTIYIYCSTLCVTILLNTVCYYIAQHCVFLYCSTLCVAILLNTVCYYIAQHYVLLYCSTLCVAILLNIVCSYMAQHCVFLYCSTLCVPILLNIVCYYIAQPSVFLYCST